MAKLTRGQKRVASAPGGFDGLTAPRAGGLLAGLVARVVAKPAPIRLLAPKRVRDAMRVVEEYVDTLPGSVDGKGGKS